MEAVVSDGRRSTAVKQPYDRQQGNRDENIVGWLVRLSDGFVPACGGCVEAEGRRSGEVVVRSGRSEVGAAVAATVTQKQGRGCRGIVSRLSNGERWSKWRRSGGGTTTKEAGKVGSDVDGQCSSSSPLKPRQGLGSQGFCAGNWDDDNSKRWWRIDDGAGLRR